MYTYRLHSSHLIKILYGIVVIIIGILISWFLFMHIGVVVIAFGILFLTSYKGVSIDQGTRRYKFFYKIAGINWGKWREIHNDTLRLTIKENKYSYSKVRLIPVFTGVRYLAEAGITYNIILVK